MNNIGEPSVEGNRVIFFVDRLVPIKRTETKCGLNLSFITGSVELDMNTHRKIFKNDDGAVYKIESFEPSGSTIEWIEV